LLSLRIIIKISFCIFRVFCVLRGKKMFFFRKSVAGESRLTTLMRLIIDTDPFTRHRAEQGIGKSYVQRMVAIAVDDRAMTETDDPCVVIGIVLLNRMAGCYLKHAGDGA